MTHVPIVCKIDICLLLHIHIDIELEFLVGIAGRRVISDTIVAELRTSIHCSLPDFVRGDVSGFDDMRLGSVSKSSNTCTSHIAATECGIARHVSGHGGRWTI